MGIVTKRGDRRTTVLLTGEEVGKADPRLEAMGVADVLCSQIGMARAFAVRHDGKCSAIVREIYELQLDLVRLSGELASRDAAAGPAEPTTAEHVGRIEGRIAKLEAEIELPSSFIIPGACEASAAMDMARAVARRLERLVVGLAEAGDYENEQGLVYLNRLSDYLFLIARSIEQCSGIAFCTKEGK